MKEFVILKLSGEALGNQLDESGIGLNIEEINKIAKEIAAGVNDKTGLAIITGGGNLWRGAGKESNFSRVRADYIGMLGTVMNSIALQDQLIANGIKTRVFSTIDIRQVVDFHNVENAIRALNRGEVVIFAGGTGMPYFSTDTNASLKASEIGAKRILVAKNFVDGIYDSDPKANPNAKKFDSITYDEVISKELKVMDETSIIMCKEQDIELYVFNMNESGNITKVLKGEKVSHTKVSN